MKSAIKSIQMQKNCENSLGGGSPIFFGGGRGGNGGLQVKASKDIAQLRGVRSGIKSQATRTTTQSGPTRTRTTFIHCIHGPSPGGPSYPGSSTNELVPELMESPSQPIGLLHQSTPLKPFWIQLTSLQYTIAHQHPGTFQNLVASVIRVWNSQTRRLYSLLIAKVGL